jgi:hypothetical protein
MCRRQLAKGHQEATFDCERAGAFSPSIVGSMMELVVETRVRVKAEGHQAESTDAT